MIVLGAFLVEPAILSVRRHFRWAWIGLAVLWFVPAVVPPYL